MTELIPLSPAQQRMWFLQQLRPSDPAYNIVTAVEITGPAVPAALAFAVRAILSRHGLLRARFRLEGARPVQQIGPATGLPPPRLVDLTFLPGPAKAAEVDRQLRTAAARAVNLYDGPVADWSLLRLAPDRHLLVLAVHHIVFDGGSGWVVNTDLERAYQCAVSGQPSCLPAPGPGYAAFVESDGHSHGAHADDLAYWRQCLAGSPTLLRVLPTKDEPTGAGVSTVSFMLGPARTSMLRQFSRGLRATPFMTLLTIFAGVLGQYVGRNDLVVGTPVSLRDTDEHRFTVGLFINMLPLRLDLSGDLSLVDMVGRVRELLLDAFTHRAVPFERIVDELRPPRDLGHTPLFQVVFAHQESPASPQLSDVHTRIVAVDAGGAKYDLTVIATDVLDDIEITVQAAALIELADAQLFAANYDLIITASLAAPDRALSRFTLLPGTRTAQSATSAPVAAGRAEATEAASAPRSDLERQIAGVWGAVLGIDVVDIHRSFFDLGGSSLLLLDLKARLDLVLPVPVSLADLFRCPTVSSLAAYVADRGGSDALVAEAGARGMRRRGFAAVRGGGLGR